MKILVTGLCTLHWGRLQYGNIGNYYIVEPLFRQLHRVFPEAEILTTFQMTDEYIKEENITVLPMDIYYAWKEDDLELAEEEYKIACEYKDSKNKIIGFDYIEVLKTVDILINVSGDMWGDNAEHVGHDRFKVDLLKMRTAQLLGVKTVLFAGTPGPFSDDDTREFAKEVCGYFDLIVNREPNSSQNLIKWNFPMEKVEDFTCPAFLFEPAKKELVEQIIETEAIPVDSEKPLIGFTIGGFNMPVGPYDLWPREDQQYDVFEDVIEHIIKVTGGRVMLISHTNGFHLPPNFELINGRDYPILEQLYNVVLKRGVVKKEDIFLIKRPHLPHITKALIGKCDMFVTGRVHASVAAITQYVPTVFIEYEKNFIKSTKMLGFSSLVGLQDYVCEPGNEKQICENITKCWNNQEEVRATLINEIPKVQQKARRAFDAIKDMK